MATNQATPRDQQKKRTLDALERRFARAEAEVRLLEDQKKRKKRAHDEEKEDNKTARSTTAATTTTTTTITSLSSSSKAPLPQLSSNTSSRKGNFSFAGHTNPQDVDMSHPIYFQLSHSVNGDLLVNNGEPSNRKTAVDKILHELLQHGDSAQKYMQGSKCIKIDNYILLDNFVPKNGMSVGARAQALKSVSKRSKRHMSLKQHKKCGSYDLPQQCHNFEIFKPMHEKWKSYITQLLKNVGKNQLAHSLLNADLHGAIILVAGCKAASMRGTSGIMIRETAETFGIITEDNKFRVIPKKLSVFMLQADGWKITLHGDKLALRNVVP